MTILAIALGVLLSMFLMALSGVLVYALSYYILVILPKKEIEDEKTDTDTQATTKD